MDRGSKGHGQTLYKKFPGKNIFGEILFALLGPLLSATSPGQGTIKQPPHSCYCDETIEGVKRGRLGGGEALHNLTPLALTPLVLDISQRDMRYFPVLCSWQTLVNFIWMLTWRRTWMSGFTSWIKVFAPDLSSSSWSKRQEAIYYNSRRPPARVTFSCLLFWLQDLDQNLFQVSLSSLLCPDRVFLKSASSQR